MTAKLVDIPGKIPPDDLYDYAYVMKYEVVGGQAATSRSCSWPTTSRVSAQQDQGQDEEGTWRQAQEVQGRATCTQLTLVPHSKKIWKGAMVDDYFAKDRKSQRYWCLRVDPGKKK